MNYPVRSGILAFACDRDAEMLYDVLTELYASYPRPVSDSLMNLIGTHDTERILTVLGSEPGDYDRSNRALSVARLSPEKRRAAAHLLKLASLLQYTVFGIPSLYYGDEVGLEGYHDPFCRMPFPWDELEEPVRADLLAHYRALGALRAHPALNRGGFLPVGHGADWLAFRRSAEHGCAGSGNAGFTASPCRQTAVAPCGWGKRAGGSRQGIAFFVACRANHPAGYHGGRANRCRKKVTPPLPDQKSAAALTRAAQCGIMVPVNQRHSHSKYRAPLKQLRRKQYAAS